MYNHLTMKHDILYKISFIFLVIMALGSLVFYKERMLFADPAFISFEIINSQFFVISEHRYGAFITQIFPLVASCLKAPLKIVLILYSVSFYLFFLAVACISGHLLHQKKLAILFVFYLSFLVTDVYFWPNNEIHQSVGWMILFLSLYAYADEKKWDVHWGIHLSLIITLFCSVISHLLILIPFSFHWCINIAERYKQAKTQKYGYSYSLLILGFAGFRYLLSQNSWYDGSKLKGVKQMSLDSILAAFTNEQSLSFSKLLISEYWVFLLVFIIGIITLVYQKKWILLAFTVAYVVLYYLLVTLTFGQKITEINRFYFESQWMGLTLIAAVPFLSETIKLINNKKILVSIFLLLFLFKIPSLQNSLLKFQKRLAHIHTLVDDAKNKKLEKSYILNTKEMNQSLFLTWGVPVETALYSSLLDKNTLLTVKTFDKNTRVSTSRDSIYTAFDLVPISELNLNYFEFSEEGRYEVLGN